MRTARILLFLAFVTLVVVWTAYSDDVSELRAGGQSAVDALHAQLERAPLEARADLEARLDRVCAQKDCAASRLFWYTDLEEAKAAAKRLHRPIIALQLLGRLDEELSCANSRFFRTLLYSDDSISSILRERYILYWHSVRPVPRITIEMGDGRVIRQTITGNSAHFLLDENGKPLDVLPGLYSPAAFRAQLEEWSQLAGAKRDVRKYHRAKLDPDGRGIQVLAVTPLRVIAIDASRLTMSKLATEIRPLKAMRTVPAAMEIEPVDAIASLNVTQEQIDAVQFSPAAIELIRRKQPEADMPTLLGNLRRSVAGDTQFNEERMHSAIHAWFMNGEVKDLDSLSERVYREIFLTPNDDPWLGLQPASVFTAIGAGG